MVLSIWILDFGIMNHPDSVPYSRQSLGALLSVTEREEERDMYYVPVTCTQNFLTYISVCFHEKDTEIGMIK